MATFRAGTSLCTLLESQEWPGVESLLHRQNTGVAAKTNRYSEQRQQNIQKQRLDQLARLAGDGMTDDAILDETLMWLRAHCHQEWGDHAPIDVFNRLLAKSIRAEDWKEGDHLEINESQIQSLREERSTQELALLRRSHDRFQPAREDCPIIIAVYEGKEWLLDGTTRINLWLRQRSTQAHPVNVHILESVFSR
jgi:hypothetical protein